MNLENDLSTYSEAIVFHYVSFKSFLFLSCTFFLRIVLSVKETVLI